MPEQQLVEMRAPWRRRSDRHHGRADGLPDAKGAAPAFAVVRSLRATGRESSTSRTGWRIFALADRVTVLRCATIGTTGSMNQ